MNNEKLNEVRTQINTRSLTARVDDRYLATLILFWHSQREFPKSTSELVNLSLRVFVEFLVTSKKIDFVHKYEDALEIIINTGHEGKVNPKNLALALASENSDFNPASPPIDSKHQKTKKKTTVVDKSPEVSAAEIKMRELQEEELQRRIAEEKERTQEFNESLIPEEFKPKNKEGGQEE